MFVRRMPATIAADHAENVHPRTTRLAALALGPEAVVDALADVRHRQGRLIGRMEALGFDLQRETVLGTLVEDVVTSMHPASRAGCDQTSSTSHDATLRLPRSNSTPIRWIGWPRWRYLSA